MGPLFVVVLVLVSVRFKQEANRKFDVACFVG